MFTTRRRRRRAGDVEEPGDAPISGFSKPKAELDEAVAAIAAGNDDDSPAAWTIHDLRRTAATTMGKLGVSRFIQSRVLNHADQSVTGINALEKWGRYIENLTRPPGANVVPLRRES